jgi:uncharacterized protein (DUF736 family)
MKNFSIFKKDNKGNDKLPTHTISGKVGDNYVEIGACWTKDSTNGKYLFCKLSDAWVDTKDSTKSRKSYMIVAEDEIELPQEKLIDPSDGRDITPTEDIPF